MKLSPKLTVALSLMCLTFLVGCSNEGESSTSASASTAATLVSVRVDPSNLALSTPTQLKAYAMFSDGRELEVTDLVIWSSTQPTKITISATGEANASQEYSGPAAQLQFGSYQKIFNLDSTCLSGAVNADGFFGGTGTALDPYLICNVNHLARLPSYPAANFKLLSDITGSETALNDVPNFSGTFDGNNKTLSSFKWFGATTTTSGSLHLGLVRELSGTIKNLRLDQIKIAGGVGAHIRVGAVAGQLNAGGVIENVRVTNSEIEGGLVGGLVGRSYGTIKRSSYSGLVKGSSVMGGLVGWVLEPAVVTDCFTLASVQDAGIGATNVGGLFGRLDVLTTSPGFRVEVRRNYSFATLSGSLGVSFVAGLIGMTSVINGSSYVIENQVWFTPSGGASIIGGYFPGSASTTLSWVSINVESDKFLQAKYPGFDFVNIWQIEAGVSAPTLR
jgi:hypothetical protein